MDMCQCVAQQEETMEMDTGSEVSECELCSDKRKQAVKQQQERVSVDVMCLLVQELVV